MTERPTGYSVLSFGQMINSEPRMRVYAEALRQAIRPGCTVLDIGAGPGIFSILACKYGAGSVVAIDPDDSIELVGPLAETNGCADKISVFKGLSTDFPGQAKADVIISDLRGILPLFEGHIPAIADARERLLVPGGTLIPARDTLRIAIVEAPEEYRHYEEPWLRNQYEVNLARGHRFAANTLQKVNLQTHDLLSRPHDLAVLDYRSIVDPNMLGEIDLQIERGGTAHGLLIWFDAELAEGIGFSNSPGEPRQVYGQTLFPFEHPVAVVPGDRVTGELGARLIDGSYTWSWRSKFWRGEEERGIEYRQSSFLAKVFSPESLHMRASSSTPQLRAMHEVDRICLSLIDGQRSLYQMAEEIMRRFPAQFSNSTDALNHVTRLVARYDRIGCGE